MKLGLIAPAWGSAQAWACRLAWIAASLALAACGGGASDPTGAAAPPEVTPWTDVLPTADCSPGTRAAVGSAACVPVGVTACPAGFAAHASGWGCREIAPAAACEGATREALGSTTCVPIGDCDAPFPPSAATLFVDASFAAGQVDAAHFRTIVDAVNAAPSGATIAVERGTYVESVSVRAPVTIAGRCARDVIVQSPDGSAGVGVQAGAKDVVVRGLTLRGHTGGVVSVKEGSVTVEDCLVDHAKLAGLVVSTGSMTVRRTRVVDTQVYQNGSGVGIMVQRGTIAVEDSAVVRSIGAAVGVGQPGASGTSKAQLARTILRDVASNDDGSGGAGASVTDNGELEIVESAIAGVRATGVELLDGAKATVSGSTIRDVAPNARGDHGDGIAVGVGAHATVDGSTVINATEFGAAAIGSGATLVMANSIVIGEGVPGGPRGRGVTAYGAGSVSLAGVAVLRTEEVALLAQDAHSLLHAEHVLVRDVVPPPDRPSAGNGAGATFGGSLELVDATILEATPAGVVVGGDTKLGAPSQASLDHVAILRTRGLPSGESGRGLEASASSTVTVTDSIISGQPEAGLVAGQSSNVSITRTVIAETSSDSPYRHGLVALDGAVVALSSSLVRDNGGAALAFRQASGVIDDVLVTHNTVGIFVSGAALREVETLGEGVAGEVLVHATRFVDNTSRASAGDLPLPAIAGL